MTTQNSAPGPLVITLGKEKFTATTYTLPIAAVDYFGNPVYNLTFTGENPTNNGDGSFTFARPINGAGDLLCFAIAAADGYFSVQKQIIVPQQDAVPQSTSALSAIFTPTSSSTGNIVIVSTGTVTYKLNGTLIGTPTSPLSVSNPAALHADDVYAFHCLGLDGTTKDQTVIVPAQIAASSAVPQTASTQSLPFGYTTQAQADLVTSQLKLVIDTMKAKGLLS